MKQRMPDWIKWFAFFLWTLVVIAAALLVLGSHSVQLSTTQITATSLFAVVVWLSPIPLSHVDW